MVCDAHEPKTLPAPIGCVGPRDGPMPVRPDQGPALRKLVCDAAGEKLSKDAVERICYLVRRAHGMGLAHNNTQRSEA